MEIKKTRPGCPSTVPTGGMSKTMTIITAISLTITIVGMIIILNIVAWEL